MCPNVNRSDRGKYTLEKVMKLFIKTNDEK